MSNIKRKIHFFSSSFKKADGKSGFEEIDPVHILEYIQSLKYNDPQPDNDRYLLYDDKRYAILDYQKQNDNLLLGRIGTVRLSSLPSIEGKGQIRDLLIQKDEGIAEISHFVYFPRNKILAMEYNHYGPRVSTLAQYLQVKAANLVDDVHFDFLLNQDLCAELERSNTVSMFSLKVPKNKIYLLKELDQSLHQSFRTLEQVDEAKDYEMILRARKGDQGFFQGLKEKLPRFLADEEKRQAFSKFQIRAFDEYLGRRRIFDLLQDKLEVEEEVVRQERHRAVDTDDMYKKIIKAYNRKKTILEKYVV